MDDRDFLEIRNRLRFLCELAIVIVAMVAGYFTYHALQGQHWSNGASMGSAFAAGLLIVWYLKAQSETEPLFDDRSDAIGTVAGAAVLCVLVAIFS